jgi:hypothetical protein
VFEYIHCNKYQNFNTLSLVDSYVQICNGTAVEHGSLLNCSGVCDGINCWGHLEIRKLKIKDAKYLIGF